MIIELLNGTRFDISDYSLGVEDYEIPSVEIAHTVVNITGRNSPIITETNFNGRTIRVDFVYLAYDYGDYPLLRDELNALFIRKEAFYITFKDQPFKRWLVKTASQFATQKELEILGSMPVNFLSVKGFSESVGTSLDLQNRKEYDVDLWGYGMGIERDKEYFYQFMTEQFDLTNIGNVTIDPCEHELEIVFRGIFSNFMRITNHTTGEIYQYNRSLAATDELKVIGVRTFRNGISDFRNTNKKLITLAPGKNSITVEGGTLASIAFKFRFLYK